MEKAKKFLLDEATIKQICELAANAAIERYEKEQENARKKRREVNLHNAKKLIVNYRRFKAMCESSVFDENTTNDLVLKDILELMSEKSRDSDLEVMSIKEKNARTKLIMNHVDTMLEVFKKQCETSVNDEDYRLWDVISMLYIREEPYTVDEVAEEMHVTVSTVYRDCNKAYKRLSVLLFGIDGVEI